MRDYLNAVRHDLLISSEDDIHEEENGTKFIMHNTSGLSRTLS